MIQDEKKLEKYIKNFYENKPKREHFNGMVPVNKEYQIMVQSAMGKMFGLVDSAMRENNCYDSKKQGFFKGELMKMINPWKNKLNNCIFESDTPEEGEKCAEEFLKKILGEGISRAEQMSNSLYK